MGALLRVFLSSIFRWTHCYTFYNFSNFLNFSDGHTLMRILHFIIFPIGASQHILAYSRFPMGAVLCTLHLSLFPMDTFLHIYHYFSSYLMSALLRIYQILNLPIRRIAAYLSIIMNYSNCCAYCSYQFLYWWHCCSFEHFLLFFQWAHCCVFSISLIFRRAYCCVFYIFSIFLKFSDGRITAHYIIFQFFRSTH